MSNYPNLLRPLKVGSVYLKNRMVSTNALPQYLQGPESFPAEPVINQKPRREHLDELKNETRTMIFYEAPHKLVGTLEDMLKTFGDRPVALVREITKIHEEVIRTTLSAAVEKYGQEDPRGEFVLIVGGATPEAAKAATPEEAAEVARAYLAEGMSPSEAAKQAAADTGLKKGDIYRLLLNDKENG